MTVQDAASTPIAGNTEMGSLTIVTRPTMSGLIHMAAALSRGGWFANGFGGYAGAAAVVGLLIGVPLIVILPAALVAVLLISGYFSAPFIWFVATRRRDLTLSPTTITMDPEGVTYQGPTMNARHAWSVYRRARDVGNAIVLEAGPGIAVAIQKDAVGNQAALMSILAAHGLIREPTSMERARPLLALALGAAVYAVQLVVQGSLTA